MTVPGPIVYKFGGTSVGSADRIRNVAEIVCHQTEPLIVVVSAMAGVTNELVRICDGANDGDPGVSGIIDDLAAKHLEAVRDLDLPEDHARELTRVVNVRIATLRAMASGTYDIPAPSRDDEILTTGEDLSAPLVVAAIRAAGRDARWLDARKIVRTTDRHGSAAPHFDHTAEACTELLAPLYESGAVAVVQGFVGASADGLTTTLGRGGGDYTAALLAGACKARMLHIWTDVAGIMSGDPRVVSAPRLLQEIGSEEVVELAYFGAKVIHPGAAVEAVMHKVPMRIRSTFEPSRQGTLVRNDKTGASEIAAVASKSGVTLVKVQAHPWSLPYGFLARVFGVLGRHQTPVDLVSTSHSTTSFTLNESEDLDAVVAELQEFSEVEVVRDLATITVVGHGLMSEPGMNALVFWAVGKTPVHLVAQASEVSVSFLVDEVHCAPVLQRLHASVIELRESARDGSDFDVASLPLPAQAEL